MKKTLIKLSFIVVFISLFATSKSIAQELAVSNIPEELLSSSNAIVRFDDTDFFIESIKETTSKRHWAITILNERGLQNNTLFKAYYDQFSKIKKIEGTLYDANGKVLEKLKANDIEDVSISNEGITDNRVKIALFSKQNHIYPFTVEFSYEKQDKNMLFFPTWMPISKENIAVQSATFSIHSNEIPFRIKQFGTEKSVFENPVFDTYHKSWSVKNIIATKFEDFSQYENLLKIVTAPKSFVIEGYKGEMRTWNDVGKFYSKLNQKRDQIPNDVKNELKALIDPSATLEDKIKICYEFMQSHTRYMSIQLGIGGWQSMLASEVAKKGYGDCKALSNYTIALLKSVDIKAYPVLIKAGTYYNADLENFPSMNFNHVIVCVPTKTDTIWLESTSQTNPMGYLGSFTGNRKGLMIHENGGELVQTKNYSSEDNFQYRKAEIWIESDGNASVNINSKYGGTQQSVRTMVANSYSKDQQRNYIQQNINIPSFELQDFEYHIEKKMIPAVSEIAELEARKLASVSGKRMFLRPNILSTFYKTPIKDEQRETQLYLNPNIYTLVDEDEITYHLPKGYKIEKISKNINFSSTFGSYSAQLIREGNTFKYHRKVSLTGGNYDKSLYNEWVEFLKSINKADRLRVVFLKSET